MTLVTGQFFPLQGESDARPRYNDETSSTVHQATFTIQSRANDDIPIWEITNVVR